LNKTGFVSAEHFSGTNTSLLASTLESFKTTIIVSYRPFYDLLASKYRQQEWHHEYENESFPSSFDEWATPELISEKFSQKSSWAVYSRYEKDFDDIKVYTLNDDMMRNIICDGFSANHTCTILTNESEPPAHFNVRAESTFTGSCLDEERIDLLFNLSIIEREGIGNALLDGASTGWEVEFEQAFNESLSTCFGLR
jgi:hypothetical protein